MFVEELELLLGGAASLEQLAQGLEPNGPVTQGDLTGFLDGLSGIAMSQAQQTHQDPHAGDAACLQHQTGPSLGLRADQSGSLQ